MKLKNLGSTYKLQNLYVWSRGETLEVPDEIARHVLEAQGSRFEVVEEHPVEEAPDRMQKAGRKRFTR